MPEVFIPDEEEIRPHNGPQTIALSSSADILIFGGSAGSGKSRCLLMELMRHLSNGKFGGVIFRRSFPNIRNEGGLWDESKLVYPALGGEAKEGLVQWVFPSGAKVQFRHLATEKELLDWHGAQVPFFGFDELTEFTEQMFWYLLSRNRSTSGVKPYIRATCNPDADSWVAGLIDWWLDEEGFPDMSKSGVIRWFVRLPEGIAWANSRDEAVQLAIDAGVAPKTAKIMPKSFTFVPAKLEDNPTLEKHDPGYRANLMALPYVDRMRLLEGNWKIRPEAGLLFPRTKWKRVKVCPAGLVFARGWDKAGTEGGKGARTAGPKLGLDPQTMRWYVCHTRVGRWSDIEREDEIYTAAQMDAAMHQWISIVIEQEPGSGGKESALATVRRLRGYDAHIVRVSGSKPSRWRPFATQVQAGNVYLVDDGTWDVNEYVNELDALSGDEVKDKNRLKDLADGSSLAFNFLASINDFTIYGDLIASGDDFQGEETKPVPDDEIENLPGPLGDVLSEIRQHKRTVDDYDDDW